MIKLRLSVGRLSDGRFVVAWTSQDNGANGDIRGRIFNADGTPATVSGSSSDFLISSTTAADQKDVTITGLADGRLFAAWASFNGSDYDIRGRFFNADGSPATVNGTTNDFLISTTNARSQSLPVAKTLADGRVAVVWQSLDIPFDGSNSDQYGIHGRIFNADGSAALFKGSTSDSIIAGPNGINQFPSVTSLLNGGFVVAWDGYAAYHPNQEYVYGNLFGNDGAEVGSLIVSAAAQNFSPSTLHAHSAGATLADGRFVFAWFDSGHVNARLFNADGSVVPVGGSTLAFEIGSFTTQGGNAFSPNASLSVTSLDDGRFFVTWDSFNGVDYDLHGRMFLANATASGSELLIGSTTQGQQRAPEIVELVNGRLVVSYQSSDPGDGSGTNIRTVLLDPDAPIIAGNDSDNFLTGTGQNEVIQALGGSDTLDGGGGADMLDGGVGNDLLYFDNLDTVNGAAGLDFATAYNSSAGVNINTAASQVEGVYGSAFDDVIDARGGPVGGSFYGHTGNDVIYGTSLADYINGGGGADTISAGAGNDTIYFDNQDTVDGGAGFDFATAYDSPAGITINTLSANVEGVYGSRFNDVINAQGQTVRGSFYGSDGDDQVTGSNFDDFITGGAGADTLNAGGGNDSIEFDSSDTISGGSGSDFATAFSSAGAININTGASTVEGVYGSAFNDTIDASSQGVGGSFYGYNGDDTITGSGWNDYINSGAGADVINGGDGDDLIEFDSLDTINGGPGFDFATAFNSSAGITINVTACSIEGVYGSAYNDIIDASGQNVRGDYYGYDGNDVFFSSPKNDFFHGGNGFDYVTYSGPSSDFTWSPAGSGWTVTQTSTGVADGLVSIEVLRFTDGEVVL